MKTKSLSVSLPTELAEFARQDMSLGQYGNFNKYLRDLLRKRRAERIEQDVRFLEGSIEGAPTEDPGEKFFERVTGAQKEVRATKKRKA